MLFPMRFFLRTFTSLLFRVAAGRREYVLSNRPQPGRRGEETMLNLLHIEID